MNFPTLIDRIYSFSCESFMANRTGLDGTMLHYLAVWQAMVSVYRPVHSKKKKKHANLLTYLANGRVYTLENGFQGEYYMPGSLFLKPSLLHIVTKKLPEWARTKT